MNRLITIFLCICGAVVCAFLAFLGHKQDQQAKTEIQSVPPEFTCESLLEEIPDDLYSFTITEFQPGRHFVPTDADEDGKWEQVIIPLFPESMKKLERNYKSLIIVVANAPDKDSLFEKVNSESIEASYWFTSQELDSYSYNRLAEKYSSMDFGRSRVLYSGFPKTENSLGKILLWSSSAGIVLSMLVLGWQSFSLVAAGIKRETEHADSDEDEVVTNRAGLPTKQEEYRL